MTDLGRIGSTTAQAARNVLNTSLINAVAYAGLLMVTLAIVGFAATSGFLYPIYNTRYHDLNKEVNFLEENIDLCHCFTFPDDTFGVFDNASMVRTIQFDAGNITTNLTRVYLWPSLNGTVLLDTTLVPQQSSFPDNLYQVFGGIDNTKRIQFDVSLLSVSSTRIFSMAR